jgi:hypothetical protein
LAEIKTDSEKLAYLPPVLTSSFFTGISVAIFLSGTGTEAVGFVVSSIIGSFEFIYV